MFGIFKRKKHSEKVSESYENLQSYAIKLNAAKSFVEKDAELANAIKLLQDDLHYTVPTANESAKKELENVSDLIENIIKMCCETDYDGEAILKNIKLARAGVSVLASYSVK